VPPVTAKVIGASAATGPTPFNVIVPSRSTVAPLQWHTEAAPPRRRAVIVQTAWRVPARRPALTTAAAAP